MSHALNPNKLLSGAKNTDTKVLWLNNKFSVLEVTSTNDLGSSRSKLFIERKVHGQAPADAVLVFARINLDGKDYFILTRQWREATKKYCIDTPAGVYNPDRDHNARDAGLRELREETPLDANVVFESIVAYSSAGCTSEIIQVLFVDAKPKNDHVKFEGGIVTGPTAFDHGEQIETIYVLEEKFYEELQKLNKQNHAIDARLMAWAFNSWVARQTQSKWSGKKTWVESIQDAWEQGNIGLCIMICISAFTLCCISSVIALLIAGRNAQGVASPA